MCDVEWLENLEDIDSTFRHYCELSEGHDGEHRCHCGEMITDDELD